MILLVVLHYSLLLLHHDLSSADILLFLHRHEILGGFSETESLLFSLLDSPFDRRSLLIPSSAVTGLWPLREVLGGGFSMDIARWCHEVVNSTSDHGVLSPDALRFCLVPVVLVLPWVVSEVLFDADRVHA